MSSEASAIIAHCGMVGTAATPTLKTKLDTVTHDVLGSRTVTLIVVSPEAPVAGVMRTDVSPARFGGVTVSPERGTIAWSELVAVTCKAFGMVVPLTVKKTVMGLFNATL